MKMKKTIDAPSQ